MPWKEIRPVEERMRFIVAVQQDPRGNFTRLCESFGISRAKGYKWLARFNELGPRGLEDRAPVARACPQKTSDAVVDQVVAMRKEHPYDGPKKLRDRLQQQQPQLAVPAASTIGDLLKQRGLIRPRRARVRVPPSLSPLDPCAEPNDVWCTDFKGHFALGDRTRCHPLTIMDGASRYLIKCEGLSEEKTEPVRMHFERAFREFGLPHKIRSDNGAPFASKALGGLSALSARWIQLGILPERIEPGQPQQNGRHERMHRTLKEQTANPPCTSMAEQQRHFDRFRRYYNEERPHEALGQKPPATCYEPSRRAMPDRPRAPDYGEDFVVRRTSAKGVFKWKGTRLRAGKPLANQPLGLRQTDDDEWELYYGPLLIGVVLVRNGAARVESLS